MGKHSKMSVSSEDSIYMNVIPMVDIMFLLLLFFMLTADFGGRELEEVTLASGVTIKEDKQEEAKGRINLNIFHTPTNSEGGGPSVKCVDYDAKRACQDTGHWNIAVRGKRYETNEKLEQWAKDEAYWHKKEKESKSEADAKNPQIPTLLRVMIRCDMRCPFQFPQLVMEKMAVAGIYKLEYGASEPPKKK
ncbi:MAG: biopolymer transporter ExbD [Planctomycetota bacterium]